ncbi:MAG TPA: heme-binding protein, partial [Verrucomicrobiae bacterium]|nr:heme-binding protein [Verrucomicrobiae bacterium]
QVWVTGKKWGPFPGELLHCSYGECALYLVMRQEADGVIQGGAVRFPLKFTSSAMRPRFNPRDGQLYVAGLQGWQTKAAKLAGLDRVRYTGKPVYSVSNLQVDKQGVHLTFTQPLDPAAATDAQNYSVQRWNYDRAEHYGSPEFSVSDPKKRGHDSVEVTGVKLSADGKTVTLQLQDVRKVMQQQIKFGIKAKDGTPINQEIQHTINIVPDRAMMTSH